MFPAKLVIFTDKILNGKLHSCVFSSIQCRNFSALNKTINIMPEFRSAIYKEIHLYQDLYLRVKENHIKNLQPGN